MQKIIINLVRLYFLGLLIFELLSYSNFIHFKPTYTWFGLFITLGIVWIILELLNKRCNNNLHIMAWLAAAVSISIDAFGDIFHWYATIPYYDKYAHFIGGGMTALFVLAYLLSRRRSNKLSIGNLWLVFATVQTFGLFYEFEEFYEDFFAAKSGLGLIIFDNLHRLPDNFLPLVRWGGGIDTMGDLGCNFLGSLIAIILFSIIYRRFNRRNKITKNPSK